MRYFVEGDRPPPLTYLQLQAKKRPESLIHLIHERLWRRFEAERYGARPSLGLANKRFCLF